MLRSNKTAKEKQSNASENTTRQSKNILKGGHRRSKSSLNILFGSSDFLNPESNDLLSLSSNNSFTSLHNVQSPTNIIGSNPNHILSFDHSIESLHSLPDDIIFLNKNQKSFYNNSNNLKKLKKKQFISYLKDKNKSNRKFSTPPPMEASTIMEDDESEQVLNVPMLPAFGTPNLHSLTNKTLNESTTLQSQSKLKSNETSNVDLKFNKSNNNIISPFDDDNSISSIVETESNRILKSAIDQDFNVNFSKDSTMLRGRQILELRKKKGLPPQRKKVFQMSSSDDDASTENDDDYHHNDGISNQNHLFSVNQYLPNADNESIKTENSQNSKKNIFKSIFRKRGYSIDAESVKSSKSNKQHDVSNMDNTGNNNIETGNKESRFYNSRLKRNSISMKRSLEELSDTDSPDKEININEKQNEYGESDINDSSIYKHEISDPYRSNPANKSTNNGEHFLKNIFHLNGLLGQGGLIPNLNLYHNNNPNVRRGDQVHDEENPPPDFHDEIRKEAQVLVGHMMRSPLEDLKKNNKKRRGISFRNRKLNKNQKSKNLDLHDNISTNNSTSDLNTISGSSTGLFVPERAHLPIDPFDDLQDIDKFSIDVPENVASKPRKYRAGIQSALFQLYNTHTIPSTSSSTITSSPYDENLSEVFYDSETNDSNVEFNDLNMNMNISAEIKKNGLNRLHNNTNDTFGSEFNFGSKLHEMTNDAEVHVENFNKRHRRGGSLQNMLFSSDGSGIFRTSAKSSVKPTNTKRKTDVSFALPDFGQKPSSSLEIDIEKKQLQGYKNLKRRSRFNKKLTKETTARITVHIADVLERQRFILTLCKAFMLYGAPTHRLEEYMSMTAQVLEIDGSFIYFPGCMLVSFGDLNARSSEMKLVRCAQGLDLGKLDEVHDVYKNVVHDRLGTIEGYKILDEIMNRKPKFNAWWCILFYSIASLAVAPWSFGGSWIDLPICFGIGSIIGFLQFVVCPKNTLYSSVFEVTSSIIASFIARAIGSINHGNTFCYAAIVQSPLALILPGYIILCGSLELQSRNIVAGSVRMFYAFIYSLMLSFGITLGAALYGWIDKEATSTTTCSSNISPWYRFLFIPMFTIGIALTNQASWSQLPMMCVISGSGYVVTYFSSLHFKQVTELNATLGCFIIGLVSNIYSRTLKSFNKYFTARGTFMTVSLMLPAIFVQVPSGIASQGSVFTGITTANNIVHSNSTSQSTSDVNSLSFGMVMIQVALGISVGLYLSTILVYPFGKKRTGLFTL
jgi:uncharacterized membrane protein YjjP (DUF1212 family)